SHMLKSFVTLTAPYSRRNCHSRIPSNGYSPVNSNHPFYNQTLAGFTSRLLPCQALLLHRIAQKKSGVQHRPKTADWPIGARFPEIIGTESRFLFSGCPAIPFCLK